MATKESIDTKPKLTVEEEIDMIKNAPIEEVAKYFGGDLNLAVQLRVDAAVDEAHDKLNTRNMEISVRPVEAQGSLRGFASVTIAGIKIDDFKIVEKKDGELFVGMPSKPDKSTQTGYRNTVNIEKGYKASFDDAVLRNYHAVDKTQAVETKRPERMADQIANAKKQAEKHNAELPVKEKSDKTPSGRD